MAVIRTRSGVEMSDHVQVAPDAVDYVLQMLLKAADLAHTTAARDDHTFWVSCLEEEMFRQVCKRPPPPPPPPPRGGPLLVSTLFRCKAVPLFLSHLGCVLIGREVGMRGCTTPGCPMQGAMLSGYPAHSDRIVHNTGRHGLLG